MLELLAELELTALALCGCPSPAELVRVHVQGHLRIASMASPEGIYRGSVRAFLSSSSRFAWCCCEPRRRRRARSRSGW